MGTNKTIQFNHSRRMGIRLFIAGVISAGITVLFAAPSHGGASVAMFSFLSAAITIIVSLFYCRLSPRMFADTGRSPPEPPPRFVVTPMLCVIVLAAIATVVGIYYLIGYASIKLVQDEDFTMDYIIAHIFLILFATDAPMRVLRHLQLRSRLSSADRDPRSRDEKPSSVVSECHGTSR